MFTQAMLKILILKKDLHFIGGLIFCFSFTVTILGMSAITDIIQTQQ